MNKVVNLIIAFFVLLNLLMFPLAANAAEHTNTVILSKDQIINKDYFAAGDTVIISGTVNGDVYVAGGTIIVDGVINGDLLAAGGNITIQGKVTQDVRATGGQITINGTIGRNLTTAGGSVTLTNTAKITGSLAAGAGSISVFAPIGKEANIGAGQATLGNTINGDVQAGVGQLTMTSQAKVKGNVTYWSDNSAQIDPAASISGATVKHIVQHPKEKAEQTRKALPLAGVRLGFTFFSFLAALLVGLLFTTLAPVYAEKTGQIVIAKPLQSLGIGFLSMVVAPIIFILLLITVIGIPLDFILLAGFMILIYFAKIIIGISVGSLVLTYFKKQYDIRWTFIIGLLIYYILTIIPLLGFLVWMVTGLMGLGALLIQKKSVYLELRKNKNI